MKQDNSQNTQSHINPVLAKVLDLLGMNKDWFEETKSSIDAVLKQAKKPENIINKKLTMLLIEMWENPLADSTTWKKDREVSLAMIRKDSSHFAYLDPQFKNLEFWKKTLESMIKEKSSFIALQKFISDNFTDKNTQKELWKYISSLEWLFLSDVDKSLIDIKQNTPNIYTAIFAKRFLDQRKKQLVLHSEFVSFFRKHAQDHTDYFSLEAMDRVTFDLWVFQKYLWFSDQQMTEEMVSLCMHLRSLISLKNIKTDTTDIDESNQELEDDDDREEFESSSYSYVFSGEMCSIDIWWGQDIKISQGELDIMTDTAVENYVQATKMFTDLGLWFILNHKRQFFWGICWFDYLSGDGLDESKCLRVLNKIGKKVGLPTDESVEWETSKKCFKILWEAKSQFRDILSTGNVWYQHYDPMKSDKSVVRRALEDRWWFDREWRWFVNLRKW